MIKNFLDISNLSADQLINIITKYKEDKVLNNKNIGLLFEKPSTRTRVSFKVAINHLGGSHIDLNVNELNLSRGESFEDTFKTLQLYLDGIIYRTSKHDNFIEASKHFEKPIINALSDKSHPCQILSDLLTLKEHFKTFNFDILWMGDINNVCFSLIEAVNLIEDINLTICSPISIINKNNWISGSNISLVDSLNQVDLRSINCVMTDVFLSMNDVESYEKIDLLKPYCVTSELMSRTNKNSVFMHCLPAKVDFEVSEEVFRSPKSIVWKQAYNRMVAQKKLLQFIYQ